MIVTDEYKYLRVILDSQLRFDKHAKYIRSIRSVYPKVKTLGHIRTFVSKTALYLYSSLIQPVFDHADFVYDPLTVTKPRSTPEYLSPSGVSVSVFKKIDKLVDSCFMMGQK